ncbi:hypothetical protein BSKO_00281 [Bryopsis sp. KO-2023]|nr:hypothetical protein BSKO_00281 [Bryopsis sp. KO-2023]
MISRATSSNVSQTSWCGAHQRRGKSQSTVCRADRTVGDSQRVRFKDGTDTAFCPILNGCWTLAGGHGREVFNNIEEKLAAHASAGFTTFDTADIYGPSERILGKFQQDWREQGNEPVQIFTKYVPNIFRSRPGPRDVEQAVKTSLENLRLSSLELVQLHWWDYGIPGMVDTAKALKDCQEKGMIKSLGATNIGVDALTQIVDAGVPMVSNQVQFSLLDRRPLNGMVQYCQENDIRLLTYGSVGGGLLSDRYVEQPEKGLFGKAKYKEVEQSTSSQKMYYRMVNYFGGTDLWRELLQTMDGVAKKHDVSVANVALKWVMSQGNGNMVHPIVGLRNTSHILDNARTFALVLDAEDFQAIDDILARAKGPNGDIYSFERA